VIAFAAVVVAVVLLVTKTVGGPKPEDTVDAFVSDWSKGDDRAAADQTDQPKPALAAFTANRNGLDKARLKATRDSVKENGDNATAQVRMEWTVPGIGLFAYGTEIRLRKQDDKWKVRWAPTVVHPDLDRTTRLGTTREPAQRGAIRDRTGSALVTERPVVRVGVTAGKVKSPRRTAAAIDDVVDIDAGALARAIRGAGPQQFVPAITLREEDVKPLEARLEAIPGVELVAGTDQLAPTKEFGRAVLGAVGPATAEQLKELGPGYAPGDEVGQWGLEARYEKQLAGAAARKVVIRDRGVPIDTLKTKRGRRGRSLRTTLDRDVQQAAEDALGKEKRNAALVAVEPSTGDVLAVANRPLDSSYDRALEGRYPPGSTFKVVTTAALLRRGLKVDETVDCPKTTKVGGRSFRNFEGSAAGPVPFSRDFAESCNTAFVSLADRLKTPDLTRAGRDYGLGRKPALELAAPAAGVPPPRDDAAQASMMIGQDRILASPLSMAGVPATVAEGRWRAPRLVSTDPKTAADPPKQSEVSTLRSLMRKVVTEGTGTALASVPGEPAGKSGTAEFGNKNPPDTHAWFISFRGDMAIAVLVERGVAGGRVAAPIAAKFWTGLGTNG
jgi:cell division protein FtsI/penicillin-binding protein 2